MRFRKIIFVRDLGVRVFWVRGLDFGFFIFILLVVIEGVSGSGFCICFSSISLFKKE